MRVRTLALFMTVCSLAACNRQEAANAGPALKNPGRYSGIGTFDAGRLWAQIADVPASQDPAAAKLADDEHIIVVLDSHTGEVRQCGDHSGICVAMNPWSAEGSRTLLPAKLKKHADDLAAEDQANLTESDTVSNTTANATAAAR